MQPELFDKIDLGNCIMASMGPSLQSMSMPFRIPLIWKNHPKPKSQRSQQRNGASHISELRPFRFLEYTADISISTYKSKNSSVARKFTPRGTLTASNEPAQPDNSKDDRMVADIVLGTFQDSKHTQDYSMTVCLEFSPGTVCT